MTNRKAAEASILSDLAKISPGCIDVELYREYFSKMKDKDFDEFMKRLESKEEEITITVPNGGKNTMDIERNIKLAESWGHTFFQNIWMPETPETPAYLTPIKYLVIKLPVRVASQRLAKKRKIPPHQNRINSLTGQVTGDSKGASITNPEIKLLAAMGLENTAVEILKYRGGDRGGAQALNASLIRYGSADQNMLKHYSTRVISTDTIKTYLTAAHLKNTL